MKTKFLVRILCVILCLILIGSVFIMAIPLMRGEAATQPVTGGSGYINDDYVNLRSGAGTTYSVVTVMNKNAAVTFVSGTLYNSEWYNIRLTDGQAGYVHKDYVTANNKLKISAASANTYVGCQYAFGLTGSSSASWKSSNTSVATVDTNGIVTAKKAGTAVVTATASGVTVTAKVAVNSGVNTGVSNSSHTMTVGSTYTLTAKTSGVSWYSSNKNVATVSGGKVTAKGMGYATISAYTANGASTCLIQVTENVAIKLSAASATTYVGCQYAFGLTGATSASWKISDTSVATVDQNGIVTAKKAGTATLSATALGKTVTAKVTVKSGVNTGISTSSNTMAVGSTYMLTAKTSGVSWYSSNKNVATVSDGKVITTGTGYATISAYTSSGASTCLIQVKDSVAIKLSASSATTYVGCQYAFGLTGATSANWKISDTSVATVDANGIVTAKKAGTATLSATALGETVNAKVTVNSGVNTGISASSRTLTLGNSYTLTAKSSGVNWYSSDKNVATVSGGKVTAKGIGYATISAYTSNGASTCLVHVTTGQGDTLKLSAVSANTYVGCQYAFGLTGATSATWGSSDTSVATVDQNGVVTAKAAGTTVILVTAAGETASCTFKVQSGSNTGISASSYTMTVGSSYTLTARTSGVSWYSSNKNVATVSGGKVTAKGTGYATISAYTANGASTCLIQVTENVTIQLSASSATTYVGCQYAFGLTGATSASWTSSNTSVASVNQNGVVTAKSAGTATVSATASGKTVAAKVTVKSGYTTGISASSVSSLPVGKSLLLKANSGVKWYSSNTKVASVSGGIVLGKGTGYATISAYTSSGASTCLVHVTDAENIRFVYASPNSAPKGSTVTFKAITDTDRTAVKFVISKGSASYTVNATDKQQNGNTYVWTGSYKLSDPGKWSIKAYSVLSNKTAYQTTAVSGEGEVFVTNSTDTATTVVGERRASDEIIYLISDYEGFLPTLTADYITSDPTIGYGKVIVSNEQFYNNLTKNEAYAYLCQTVNSGGYTTKTNEFLSTYGIKFNQQQFDALVCFAYNVGSYAIFNDSSLKAALLNCTTGTTDVIAAGAAGYVNDSGVNLRSGAGTNYSVLTVMAYNTPFTFVDGKLYNSNWYKIKLSDGTVGYIYSDYASVTATSGSRDLNKINKNDFISNLLQYHHAAGDCYWGLLYRRIDEAEIFFYGDYLRDGQDNKYGLYFRCANNGSFGIG